MGGGLSKIAMSHKLLDFLVIGVQKAGTTALDYYLRSHSDLALPNVKELHFFDNEELFKGSLTADYTIYHRAFSQDYISKVAGEVTPIYIYWENALPRIWHYNPHIKLIAVLRNPIDRAYSHWNMERQRKWESNTFMEAILNEYERSRRSLPFQDRVYSYTDRGFYTQQIRRLFRFFPKENLLFLKYEELKYNPKEALCKISDFLAIRAFSNVEPVLKHQSKYSEPMSDKAREILYRLYFEEIRALEKLLGWDCGDWLER
jgi:hypothetical protein